MPSAASISTNRPPIRALRTRSGPAQDPNDEPWAHRPSCLELDPETWFPSSVADDHELPKLICRACPAIRDCAQHALKSAATDGIWAGITLSGPSSIARQRRKLQVIADAPEFTPSKENHHGE